MFAKGFEKSAATLPGGINLAKNVLSKSQAGMSTLESAGKKKGVISKIKSAIAPAAAPASTAQKLESLSGAQQRRAAERLSESRGYGKAKSQLTKDERRELVKGKQPQSPSKAAPEASKPAAEAPKGAETPHADKPKAFDMSWYHRPVAGARKTMKAHPYLSTAAGAGAGYVAGKALSGKNEDGRY